MTHSDPPIRPSALTVTAYEQQDGAGAGAVVLDVAGELDLATHASFTAGINQALDEHPGLLIIDLTKVTFLASMGLSSLIQTHRTGAAAEPRTAVRVAAGNQLRTIQITGLDHLLAVYRTLTDALADTPASPGRS